MPRHERSRPRPSTRHSRIIRTLGQPGILVDTVHQRDLAVERNTEALLIVEIKRPVYGILRFALCYGNTCIFTCVYVYITLMCRKLYTYIFYIVSFSWVSLSSVGPNSTQTQLFMWSTNYNSAAGFTLCLLIVYYLILYGY